MKKNKVFKKGQALPLNTIVIAILVVIVLVVIVVSFTNSQGEQNKVLEDNGANVCSTNNGIISTLGYRSAEWRTDCTEDEDPFTRIATRTNSNGDTEVCCVKK